MHGGGGCGGGGGGCRKIQGWKVSEGHVAS